MSRSIALLLSATSALYAPAALAADTPSAFKDVPSDHWAQSAVQAVAVDRHFMSGYADGSFRGDQPFTRAQLALAVAELLRELEALTKISWQVDGLAGYEFKDLAADDPARATVLELGNRYRLFEGVPGVTSLTFEGDKQVTRYEMAKVIHRLMRLGEERGVVDPHVIARRQLAFVDLPVTAWDYDSVKEVAERYQVMVGFPDATFRGPEELTRYQFAATASQTFPLVRALVAKTQEQKDQKLVAEVVSVSRFLEATPFQLGLAWHPGTGWPGLAGRAGAYMGPLMALGEAQIATGVPTGERMVTAAGRLGYCFPVGTGTTVTPTLGARMFNNPALTVGGLDYGVLGYHRTSPDWGLYVDMHGTSPLGATAGTVLGSFLGAAGVGLEYNLSPRLALVAEGGYALLPGAALSSPSAAMGTFATPTVFLGASFKP